MRGRPRAAAGEMAMAMAAAVGGCERSKEMMGGLDRNESHPDHVGLQQLMQQMQRCIFPGMELDG